MGNLLHWMRPAAILDAAWPVRADRAPGRAEAGEGLAWRLGTHRPPTSTDQGDSLLNACLDPWARAAQRRVAVGPLPPPTVFAIPGARPPTTWRALRGRARRRNPYPAASA